MAREFSKSFYNSTAWKKTRKSYISSVNGLCEDCLDKGKLTPGYILHHTIELTPENIKDVYVALNFDNLRYVCLDCHNKIHIGDNQPLPDGLRFDEYGDVVEE
jgi:5-methylcytosine-specific restriction protein A